MNIRNVSNNIFKYENTVKIVIGVCLFVCLCGFDRRSSVIFYVIISILTVCAMMAINLRIDIDFFKEHKVISILTAFSTTFALVGNKTLVYPINASADYRIIIFLIFLMLLFIPSISLLCLLGNRKEPGVYSKNLNRKYYFYILFTGFIIIETTYFIAFLPGIVSWDDYIVIAEAKGMWRLGEYEGLFYVLTRRILLSIIDSVTFITSVQIVYADVVYSIVTSWLILKLDTTYNYKVLLLISFLVAALPNNALMTITLTKDTFWAVSFIWFLYSVARICSDDLSFIVLFQYIISGSLVWLIRQNGMLIIPSTFIVLLVWAVKKRKLKIIAATLMTVSLIIISEACLRSVRYESTHPGLKYVAAFQDLLGVYYSEGNLSDNTADMIESVIDEDFIKVYDPYWAEYVTWKESLGEIPVSRFIINYVSTFLRNPLKMIKSVLLRQDMLWDIQCGVNGRETWQWWTKFVSDMWPDLIPERKVTVYGTIVDLFGKFTVNSGLKEFLWRGGISLQICLLCFIVSLSKRINTIKYVPFLALILFYILGLGWEHYRYFWCINLASLFYFGYLICEDNESFDKYA